MHETTEAETAGSRGEQRAADREAEPAAAAAPPGPPALKQAHDQAEADARSRIAGFRPLSKPEQEAISAPSQPRPPSAKELGEQADRIRNTPPWPTEEEADAWFYEQTALKPPTKRS